VRRRWPLHVRCCRQKFTFAMSSPDEFLVQTVAQLAPVEYQLLYFAGPRTQRLTLLCLCPKHYINVYESNLGMIIDDNNNNNDNFLSCFSNLRRKSVIMSEEKENQQSAVRLVFSNCCPNRCFVCFWCRICYFDVQLVCWPRVQWTPRYWLMQVVVIVLIAYRNINSCKRCSLYTIWSSLLAVRRLVDVKSAARQSHM